MSDWERCSELQTLPDLLEKNGPFPRIFLKHAKTCEVCFFWTTWSLAISKALATTDRIFYPQCPSRSQFEILLFGVVSGLRKSNFQKINKNIFHVSDPQLWNAVAHMNMDNENYCKECFQYYDTLYGKIIDYQKDFARMLSAGEKIDYPPENTSLQLNIEKIDYDPAKKPN